MELKRLSALIKILSGSLFIFFLTLIVFKIFQFHNEWAIGIITGFVCSIFIIIAWLKLEVALIILTIELIFGENTGRWIEFPGQISIRMIFFGIVLLFWLINTLRNKNNLTWIKSSPLTSFILIFAFIYPLFFGMFIGGINGNIVKNIFADFNGQIFYLIFLPFFSVLYDKKKIFFFIKIYLSTIIFSASWQSIIYIFFMIRGLPFIVAIRNIFKYYLKISCQIGQFPNGVYRLYLASGIYFQSALALMAALIFQLKKRGYKILALFGIIILVFMISATYTRGYWFGAIIAVLIVLAFIKWQNKIKIIATTFIGFGLAFIISGLFFHYSLKDFYVHRFLSTIPTTLHTKDERNEDIYAADPVSVTLKTVQAESLWNEVKKKPLFGHGFGAVLPSLGQSFSYEMSYLDMLFKFGFVGFGIWITFLTIILLRGLRLWNYSISQREKALLIGLHGALCGLLFTSATNPYILASFGLGHLIITAFITEILYQKRFGATREWIKLKR